MKKVIAIFALAALLVAGIAIGTLPAITEHAKSIDLAGNNSTIQESHIVKKTCCRSVCLAYKKGQCIRRGWDCYRC